VLIPCISVSVCGQYVGTHSLHSSLERSNREFACRQESVAVTCSVSGTSLTWEAREGDNTSLPVQVANFQQGVRVGDGFSNTELFNCHGWITFTSTLVNSSSDSNQLLKSSMTVTPVSSNAMSHCHLPITISCESLENGSKPKTTTYRIAGGSLLYFTSNYYYSLLLNYRI
jgi:hypothetical protein